MDSAGSFLWAKNLEGGTGAYGINPYNINVSNLNGIYITGQFGSGDFDPDTTSAFNLYTNGDRDVFIQKLDTNGNFIWAKQMGGTGFDAGSSIATDINDNVYLTGFFESQVDFDPGPGVLNLTSNGSDDIFLQKLDANGDLIWGKGIGGTGSDGGNIIVDVNNNIYMGGYFNNTVDFDPDTMMYPLSSNGTTDAFVLKLSQSCIPTTGTDTQIACNSYTWIDGITYTSNNNTATDTLINIAGCDSIVTLDLTIWGSNIMPYQEDFTGTFPPVATSVLNPDNSATWLGGVLTATNGSTNDVMYIEYATYNAPGQKDYFVLPLLDLDTLTIAELSFDISYNPYSAVNSDTIAVEVSIDCGLSYQTIYKKGGLDLSIDNSYLTSVWIPDNTADWRKERIDLSAYLGSNILVRFVGINGYGNNLYLDNINVGAPVTTNVIEVPKTEIIKVYPTPTKDYLTVELIENSQNVKLQIVDINGRVVLSKAYQEQSKIQLSVEHLTTGIYFLKIESSQGVQMAKMLKE